MIVFPMSGRSSRFFDQGYEVPKYMLPIGSVSVFYKVLEPFKEVSLAESICFICRGCFDTPAFIERECQKLGISNFEIVVLDKETLGQADTVYLGLQYSKVLLQNEPITIFNIDTIRTRSFKPVEDYLFPEVVVGQSDAALEVFRAEGDHWSFALPDGSDQQSKKGRVALTAEKERISELCSTGLYFFKNASVYDAAYLETYSKTVQFERYIAPMFNSIIRDGREVMFWEVDTQLILACGTPAEYEEAKLRL